MDRFILFVLIFIPAVFFSLSVGCVNNLDYEWYIQAQVKIVTPSSENSFTFDEPCYIFSYEVDQDTRWDIYATDMDTPFGISISWKESFLSGPDSFQASDEISISITRENPNPGYSMRISDVDEGNITFTQVGYQSGDIIEGTFDQLRLDEWDIEKNIEINGGVFRCKVM